MKHSLRIICMIFCGIIIISCNQKKKESQVENFDWLVGSWKRTNEDKGKTTFEDWEKISETEYVGKGITFENEDTLQSEEMRLAKINDNWQLFVKTPEESQPTIFKMTEYTNDAFTCNNDTIDFPQKIHYWLDKDQLKAKISNKEMEIVFEFRREK